MKSSSLPASEILSEKKVSFMNKVYLWMMVGMLITAVSAYFSQWYLVDEVIKINLGLVNAEDFKSIVYTAIFLQFVAVCAVSFLIKRINAVVAGLLYLLYAALLGMTVATLIFTYTLSDIVNAFLITAFSFAGLSAYGYFTKKNLNFLGTFSIMGLFGLVGFSIAALFNPGIMTDKIQLETAVITIIVFAGLTAFDTQKIKNMSLQTMGVSDENAAIFGALSLYLDFINIFFAVLRLIKR